MIREIAAPDGGEKKQKMKYEGVINNASEVLKAYCWAFSDSQAKIILLRQLAQKLGLTPDGAMQKFANRIAITKVLT